MLAVGVLACACLAFLALAAAFFLLRRDDSTSESESESPMVSEVCERSMLASAKEQTKRKWSEQKDSVLTTRQSASRCIPSAR